MRDPYWWDRPQRRSVPVNEVVAAWQQRTNQDVRLDEINRREGHDARFC